MGECRWMVEGSGEERTRVCEYECVSVSIGEMRVEQGGGESDTSDASEE